jgi:uncharacterized protein (DUF1800 family)
MKTKIGCVNKYSRAIVLTLLAMIAEVLLSSFVMDAHVNVVVFPYSKAGLTKEQAAAHLLSRFTYGAIPGQVERVASQGLEKWFDEQLAASLDDRTLKEKLNGYDILSADNQQIVSTYRKNAKILKMAIADGAIDKDSVDKSSNAYRKKLLDYMTKKGLKPERELIRQFVNQKILRAAYTQNQLQEVMTEFWFNHFNVSFTKRNAAPFVPNYERDVIRPNVLGNFNDLLIATAKSPAMLLYLDNFSSAVAKENSNPKNNRVKGLNENYAREVMELHTLGVDGGYSQRDVTDAARILTGWTIFPMGDEGFGSGVKKMIEKVGEEKLKARGLVHEGDFLFIPNRHDNGEKQVMGKVFPPGRGLEEGTELLNMLSRHPSTAKFICRKLATRFVNDSPPPALVERMEKTFLNKQGNIREVLMTMVSSIEFWEMEALRSKTKSPMELAISSIRALNADVKQPYQLYNWINRMGQQLYFYQAPTGFPDRGQYWINTGALLNRMNFGLALADDRVPGVSFDLLALNNQHEPESAEDALIAYGKLLMPARSMDETVERLTPLLNAPDLQQRVNDAAGQHTKSKINTSADSLITEAGTAGEQTPMRPENNYKYRLSQVVGILIGSPEFQRR